MMYQELRTSKGSVVERIQERVRRRMSTLVVWLQLIRNLAVRDVEIRYKHSLLGLYWTIINPLITAGIFSFIFGVVFNQSAATKPIPYVVFVLTGLTFWNLFANGISSATTSVTGSASLLAKVYFPRVVLPTAAILARLIDLAFSTIVLVSFILIYHVPIHVTSLGIVAVLALELAFTLGIGYLVAALNVLYRDVSQLVGLVLMVWFYFSPVMYSTTSLHGRISELLLLNPMGAMIQAERDLLFVGHITDLAYLWSAMLWTTFVLLAGLIAFKRIEPMFSEVM